MRLQEANLGLAAIAEIQAAIVDLQRYQPVVAVIAGPVGCFGGMSIAAGLCSYVLVTREARLGLNGPQVIEQEAGIAEYDSRDRPFIWSLTGGEQRFASGLADATWPTTSMRYAPRYSRISPRACRHGRAAAAPRITCGGWATSIPPSNRMPPACAGCTRGWAKEMQHEPTVRFPWPGLVPGAGR